MSKETHNGVLKIPVDVVQNHTLIKQRDHLKKKIGVIKWVEWDEHVNFRNIHDEPKVGFSCIVNYHRAHLPDRIQDVE